MGAVLRAVVYRFSQIVNASTSLLASQLSKLRAAWGQSTGGLDAPGHLQDETIAVLSRFHIAHCVQITQHSRFKIEHHISRL